jgi:D-3-phosphoglycerate dehydrogenase/(S)-sulfolactate dehydrogenase
MSIDVLCLRPEADFARAGAPGPPDLRVAYRAPDAADVPALMREARALLLPAVGPAVPASLFEGSRVRFVQVTGAGLDRLDVPALERLGITVSNVPGGSNAAVAEYAVTAASLLLRRFLWADEDIRAGNYADARARMIAANLSGLEGLLVGVVGLGTIGTAVAEAFRGRGCRLCYYDPAPRDAPAGRLGARGLALDDLLATADVITLHVPLVPATRGLIARRELSLTTPGAVLIHAARGGVVDEPALADALASGHLGGAAVDVYSIEPPPADHPLLQLRGEAARRLLLTPHIAGVTRQSATVLLRAAWDKVRDALEATR